jgi:disulfide bond formation protein DsbB
LIITNLILKKNEKFLILLLALIFIFSFAISIYHFGIEQNFFQESAICGLKNATEISSKEELLKQLSEKTISCKDVTFRVFGFSLTTINIILSIFLIFLLIKMFLNYEKFKKQS